MARQNDKSYKDEKTKDFTKKKSKKDFKNKKSKTTSDARDEYYDSKDHTNDPAWYARNEQLLKDAANIPFNYMMGVDPDIVVTNRSGQGMTHVQSAPGIIQTYYVAPVFGNPQKWTDAMNVARRNLYTWVRHMNSGHTNYDAPNLMMYVMSMSSVYSFIEWCKRLYGFVGTASVFNRAMPAALVRANGVSYTDLSSNLADFRLWLNRFILKAATMAVPSKMPFYDRAQFLFSNLYADATNPRAQYSMFVPFYFHRYVEPLPGETSQIGTLQPVHLGPLPKSLITTRSEGVTNGYLDFDALPLTDSFDIATNVMSVADIMAYGEALLTPILTSEDFNVMSGDILKAFGVEGLKQLTTITEEFNVMPVYDLSVMHQIHNMDMIASGNTSSTSRSIVKINDTFGTIKEITSGTEIGALKLDNCYTTVTRSNGSTPPTQGSQMLLDFDLDNPTAGDIMVATRLKATVSMAASGTSTSVYDYFVEHVGSEVVICACMYSGRSGAIRYTNSNTPPLKVLGLSTDFRLGPVFYNKGVVAVQGPTDFYLLSEIQNFTWTTTYTVEHMHDVALLSLFDVPVIGAWKVKQ